MTNCLACSFLRVLLYFGTAVVVVTATTTTHVLTTATCFAIRLQPQQMRLLYEPHQQHHRASFLSSLRSRSNNNPWILYESVGQPNRNSKEAEEPLLVVSSSASDPTHLPTTTSVVGVGSKASPRSPGLIRSSLSMIPWHKVPNTLTFVRCLAIPALIVLFYLAPRQNSHITTSAVFAMASITDYLDGYLARRWNVTTSFGAFLDPVADKLMVSTALILLAGRYGPPVAIPASIILARELAVSALREWMAENGLRNVVQVGYQGKLKTAATMVAVTLLLLVPSDRSGVLGKLLQPALMALNLCVFLTVSSGIIYFQAAAPYLMKKKN